MTDFFFPLEFNRRIQTLARPKRIMHFFQLLSGFAVLPLAHCVAFGGPAPTTIESIKEAADGWTPKPTQGPSIAELRRRQTVETLDAGFNTCGWIGTDTVVGNFCMEICRLVLDIHEY